MIYSLQSRVTPVYHGPPGLGTTGSGARLFSAVGLSHVSQDAGQHPSLGPRGAVGAPAHVAGTWPRGEKAKGPVENLRSAGSPQQEAAWRKKPQIEV